MIQPISFVDSFVKWCQTQPMRGDARLRYTKEDLTLGAPRKPKFCGHSWWYLLEQWDDPGTQIRLHDGWDLPKELADLVGVQQSTEHHPEGDAFVHTCHVVDAMSTILTREGITGDRRVMFMLAALCHDFGKATHTKWHEEKQKWVAYGHDVASVPLARQFLERIGTFEENICQILPLVKCHMAHTRSGFTTKSVLKLARELQPMKISDLVLVLEADCAGRPPIPPGLPSVVTDQLIPIAKEYGVY